MTSKTTHYSSDSFSSLKISRHGGKHSKRRTDLTTLFRFHTLPKECERYADEATAGARAFLPASWMYAHVFGAKRWPFEHLRIAFFACAVAVSITILKSRHDNKTCFSCHAKSSKWKNQKQCVEIHQDRYLVSSRRESPPRRQRRRRGTDTLHR